MRINKRGYILPKANHKKGHRHDYDVYKKNHPHPYWKVYIISNYTRDLITFLDLLYQL